jgi:diguanylate cyclase (GGDEF)-like protein
VYPLQSALGTLLSSLKTHQDTLKEIAFKDPLTGLPNRRHFWDHLSVCLHSHKRNQRPFALMVIDLDGFKSVNDRLGHEAGDILLTQVSQTLRASIRQEDFLARLGGDEFTLILRDCDDPMTPKRIAKNITNALDRTFSLAGEEVQVGASIGIAMAPEDSRDAHELTRLADKAMYIAKRQVNKRYAFWQEALNELCDNLAHDEDIVMQALDQQALSIRLAPQHRFSKSQQIVGAQAFPSFTHADKEQAFAGQTLSRTIEEVIMQSDSPTLILRYHQWFFAELSQLIQHWKKTPGLANALLPITLQLAPDKLQLTHFVNAFKDALRQVHFTTADVIIQMHEHTLNRLHHLPAASLGDPLNHHFFSQLQVALTINDLPDAYTILNKAPNALVKRLHICTLEQSADQIIESMQANTTSASLAAANSVFKFAQQFGCEIYVSHINEGTTWHQFRKLGANIGQGAFLSRDDLAPELESKINQTLALSTGSETAS